MLGRVTRWGNSLAIRVPAVIAEQAGISEGSEISFALREGAILIEPMDHRIPDLDAVLARMTPDGTHAESDWGTVFPWNIR